MNKRIFKHQTSQRGEIPFYKIGTFGDIPDAFISRELFKEYKAKYPYPKKGDILLSASGSIGRIVEYLGKDEYFQDSNIIWLEHNNTLDNCFLKYFYEIVKWNGLEGSTIKRLYNKNILDTEISKPQLSEQEKIGAFFQHMDTLINTQEQKYEKLLNMKKALLEKMFPKDGAKEPELRFQGFSGEWEGTDIGSIASRTYGGGTPRTSEAVYWNGDIPWIQSSDLQEHDILKVIPQKSVSELGLQKSATKLVPKNSIAIITRVSVGKLALMPFNYATSQDFLSLSKIKIDTLFCTYTIYKKLQRELHTVQGTSIKGITKDELLAKKIILPSSKTEQTKIGKLFSTLDKRISLQQSKIAKLKHMKKALLEKMFV